MSSVVLLVRTDGRDELLSQTIDSLQQNVIGNIAEQIISTDAGKDHGEFLSTAYPAWDILADERAGFGGAIDRAWKFISSEFPEVSFVFDCEDDFTFNKIIDLSAMSAVMDNFPNLGQLALRRQPWNEAEQAAGGIVEMWPESYTDMEWGRHRWLEHSLFMTSNPSLWRMNQVKDGWPDVPKSERVFSDLMFEKGFVSGYWGARDSGEWVHHIGAQRVGTKY